MLCSNVYCTSTVQSVGAEIGQSAQVRQIRKGTSFDTGFEHLTTVTQTHRKRQIMLAVEA